MGCHTWFYRKSEHQPHYEEVREKLMDLWKKELGYYERHVSNTLSEDEAWLFEDKTVESSEYSIKVLTRLLRILKKRLCKVATMRRMWQIGSYYYCEKNGLAYSEIGKYHDIFRIGGYPPDELISFRETLAFLEKNESKIAFGPCPTIYGKEEVIRLLKNFWEENPEGLIRFG